MNKINLTCIFLIISAVSMNSLKQNNNNNVQDLAPLDNSLNGTSADNLTVVNNTLLSGTNDPIDNNLTLSNTTDAPIEGNATETPADNSTSDNNSIEVDNTDINSSPYDNNSTSVNATEAPADNNSTSVYATEAPADNNASAVNDTNLNITNVEVKTPTQDVSINTTKPVIINTPAITSITQPTPTEFVLNHLRKLPQTGGIPNAPNTKTFLAVNQIN